VPDNGFSELQAELRRVWPTVTLRSIGDIERTVVVVHSVSFRYEVKRALDETSEACVPGALRARPPDAPAPPVGASA